MIGPGPEVLVHNVQKRNNILHMLFLFFTFAFRNMTNIIV